MTTLRDTAECQEHLARFVTRAVATEQVWTLEGEDGVACCDSDDVEDATVLLFWSDRGYAKRASGEFPGHAPTEIELFAFLFRWLRGMDGDGALAGANWTPDLVGIESKPLELQERILDSMPKEMLGRYLARFKQERAAAKK